MRSYLDDSQKRQLEGIADSVDLGVILNFLAGLQFEATDSVGLECEGGQLLFQQASVTQSAAYYCEWLQRGAHDRGEEAE